MLNWNEYQKQIQKRIAEIGRTHHEVVKDYGELTNGENATKLLPEPH